MPAVLAAPIPAGWCVHAALSTCFLIAACKLCCQVAQLTCFKSVCDQGTLERHQAASYAYNAAKVKLPGETDQDDCLQSG